MRLLPLIAATALVVTVTGCGSGGDTTTTPTTASTSPSDAAAVQYVDKVCTAAAAFSKVQKTPPTLEGTDPAKLKAEMGTYLGQMADAYAQSATQLRAVGPSPVAGGDQQVEKMAATFADISKNFSDAKVATEAADANDSVGGLQAAGEAIKRLEDFVTPLKQLEALPELMEASEKAASCQDLKTVAPSEPAAPTS
jgi:hypothetical protein